jgi:2-polyprenyl-3-methyl-5-hydroxy-6-metoxy-1,4-benzoquinol methylase
MIFNKNFIKKILKIIIEIYDITVAIILCLCLKPLIKAMGKRKGYENIYFSLISFSNLFYPHYLIRQKKMKLTKSNARFYRDNYDHKGLKLYSYLLPPKILFNQKCVLDFGCGLGGKTFAILKHKPKKIIGIDLSKRNIKLAKELINSKNKKHISFFNKNLFDFQKNKQFNTILSFTVFEHIDRNLLLLVLNKMYDLLKDNGIVIIVLNHYNDKFGMHLKEYIYHPWPQTLFEEKILFKFWDKEFKNDKNITKNSYFPIEYNHGLDGHNSDCFMNLNKVSIIEFENIIRKSNLKYLKKDLYSKSFLLKIFPFLPKKYLIGSAIYYLVKSK